ncbi:MAG: hypothetical protein KF816_07595 [Melioribacteraceae bacterium]|jgi:hypothetical protein|nr:hypothetical protein [Melioribacteraceae bacterium]
MFKRRNKFLAVFIISLVVLQFNGCQKDDNPLAPEEDHFEAIGMLIYDASGKQVVKILRGVTTDTLHAESGKISDHFTVKFYNDEEKIVSPPESEHLKFNGKIDNETIAKFWQHPGEEGEFEFHIDGKIKGKTLIEFFIEHEGHADYRTGKIPLQIN